MKSVYYNNFVLSIKDEIRAEVIAQIIPDLLSKNLGVFVKEIARAKEKLRIAENAEVYANELM
jgi:hypothetical protein